MYRKLDKIASSDSRVVPSGGVWDSNHLTGCCEFSAADGTLSHNGSFISVAGTLPSLPGRPDDNTIRALGGGR